jgi:uroporphyrinogen-III synthase
MSKLVLITRPIEQAREFAEQITELGFTPLIQPLLEIDYFPFSFENIAKPAAIILSSRQSIQNFDLPVEWLSLPVFCVGEMTEQIARQKNFLNVVSGHGGLVDLLPLIITKIPAGQNLLYLRGEDVRHDLNMLLPDYEIQEGITYRARPVTQLDLDVADKFSQIDVITLFSVRSGAVLRQLIHENGLIFHVKNINLLCLSPSVVESMVDIGWGSCVSADFPNQMSVIEKLKSI